MKVIYEETILDDVLAEIEHSEKSFKNIARIELSLSEFSKLVNVLCDNIRLPSSLFDSKNTCSFDLTDRAKSLNIKKSDVKLFYFLDYSGSHINIKGVCCQTHESY